MSKWTDFVKKHYVEMKKTMKNVKLGDAMKKAAKAWKGNTSKQQPKMGKGKTMRKSRKMRKQKKRGGEGEGEDMGIEVDKMGMGP
jgi:hypothetical protein